MPRLVTTGPPADGGYPLDRDLHQMSDDGGPVGPDPSRWADPAWQDEPVACGLTYARLARLEAVLACGMARGRVRESGPADGATAAALRLRPGRTNGHALRLALSDVAAVEDVVRGSFTGLSRPESGDRLFVTETDR